MTAALHGKISTANIDYNGWPLPVINSYKPDLLFPDIQMPKQRKVKAYDREGIRELSDGSQIEVSRRKKDIVLKLFR